MEILELENTITEMKNSIDDLTAHKIQQKKGLKNKQKDRSLENIQSEA